MAGFKAASAVDSFEYDFKPYLDASGVVPEPSDDDVTTFYAGLGQALEGALGEDRVRDVDMTDPRQVSQLMSRLSKDDLANMTEIMLDLHAGVCGGSPSREQLAALPYRIKQAFYGALQGWLSPEASRPATNG